MNMRYDWDDYDRFLNDQQPNLYDEFFDEFREYTPCPFEDFEEWIKLNKLEDKYSEWSWKRFEVYRQNADESIWGEDR
jgi:hypothetical protein